MESEFTEKRISVLRASKEPLSADVFKISGDKYTWFFDVGACREAVEFCSESEKDVMLVISHFHPDHMKNLEEVISVVNAAGKNVRLFVGDNTYKYTQKGEIVKEALAFEDGLKIQIFPISNSHAKGSLGVVAGDFAFLGDALYTTLKEGKVVYNVQLLEEEIKALKNLTASQFVVSHSVCLIKSGEEVICELEEIYEKREKGQPYIIV